MKHPIYLWHVSEARPSTKTLAVRATHVRLTQNGALLLIDRNADDPNFDYEIVFAAPSGTPCWVQRIAKVTVDQDSTEQNASTSNDSGK